MSRLGRALAVTASIIVALSMDPPVAKAAGVTYTLESYDFDDVAGISVSITQTEFGGTLCPCVKVRYPADGLQNAQGVAAIANTPLQSGDTVMGFSLGAQVISQYLAQYTPPPGVRFILIGETPTHNAYLASIGQGVPANIANQVIMVVRQYDGWTDYPTNYFNRNYSLAIQNAQSGAENIHNYVTAQLNNPANVVTTQGNIIAVMIPTQHLPLNDWRRQWGQAAQADQLDAQERPLIDSAYNRLVPTPAQLAAATAEQVPGT
jgi:PE-PPE domain